jgi:hypothetical protein
MVEQEHRTTYTSVETTHWSHIKRTQCTNGTIFYWFTNLVAPNQTDLAPIDPENLSLFSGSDNTSHLSSFPIDLNDSDPLRHQVWCKVCVVRC